VLTVAVSVGSAAIILMATRPVVSWLSDLPVAAPAAQAAPPERLPVVRVSDELLEKARSLYGAGELREALRTLERIDLADPMRSDADRLRAEIQRDLLLTARTGQRVTERSLRRLRLGQRESAAP
jgi:hypothetical protein